MKIRVLDIPEDEGLTLQGTLDPEPYDLDSGQGENWVGIDYDLRADRLGKEVLVSGSLTSRLKVKCARCQEMIPYSLQVADFQHAFPLKGQESIDLTDLIREDILLGFPIAPSCDLDADNRCVQSGVAHKKGQDGFAKDRRNEIWGALDQLKESKDHGSSKKKKI